MGIMPADRELKWQRVFRRFGLPGEQAERGSEATNAPELRGQAPDSKQDRAHNTKPEKKK